MRTEHLARVKSYYRPDRLEQVDADFLAFEEDLTSEEDLNRIISCVQAQHRFTDNPHNSVLLYTTGLTDEFDFQQARANTIGGSPPDIDIDFEALGRDQAVEWVVNKWGREHVANIITHGTFKPKSLTRRFFKLTEGDSDTMREIIKVIPPPQFGKEAKLTEILEGNKDKGYQPNPQLVENPKYADWLAFAKQLEGMVANFGIHAAGMVISSHPIPDTIPCWKNSKSEFITQYDMGEVEELGSIKFDFLVINNLDILKECVRLVNTRHGKNYDIYTVPDHDEQAYKLLHAGLVTGVFQMETSGSAKTLIQKIHPTSIEELSDISALNRPGPMEAGLDEAYIENKKNGYPPADMPPALAELLKDTYWTLVYQEQIMRLVSELAGFTLREADDVRRAMGKKKMKVLEVYREPFIKGCVEHDIDKDYAVNLWDNVLIGFANYCFNKSHSVAYSIITYLCAYFKANYPLEFFTALMSVRSKVMQPKDWAQKAPEFVNEARQMGVRIDAPYVQVSEIGFTVQGNEIYFGLNAIKNVGLTACKSIIAARKGGRFKDIWDFLARVNRRKVTTRTFEALVMAGAFDRMGYVRQELLDNAKAIYQYFADQLEHNERIREAAARKKENEAKDRRKNQIDEELKTAKGLAKQMKKQGQPVPAYVETIIGRPARLRDYRARIKAGIESGMKAEEVLATEELDEYNESMWLRKKPELKLKEPPTQPELTRTKSVKVTVKELMNQAEYIGCYLHQHPAPILFPNTTRVAMAEVGDWLKMAGQITNVKTIKTRRGQPMAFMEMGDGTGMAELIVFPKQYAFLAATGTLPQVGDIVAINCKVEDVADTKVKVIVNDVHLHRPNN